MDNEITGEAIRDAVLAAGVKRIPARTCSICHSPLEYLVSSAGGLYFSGDCECTSYSSPPTPCDWEDIAELFKAGKVIPSDDDAIADL